MVVVLELFALTESRIYVIHWQCNSNCETPSLSYIACHKVNACSIRNA